MKALEILKAQKAEIEKMDIGSLKTKLLQETIKDLVEINEAIAELKALQQRSCESCKYFNKSINGGLCFRLDITVSTTFYCQGYEPKEIL